MNNTCDTSSQDKCSEIQGSCSFSHLENRSIQGVKVYRPTRLDAFDMTLKCGPGLSHTCIHRKTHSLSMRRHYRRITLCRTMRGPPIGMQQNAKLRLPLFSKINANSVTCQVQNVLSELPNECFCVRCEPHATQLPAGSNTHYPCGIIPPSDRPRLPCSLFSLLQCMYQSLLSVPHVIHTCGILLYSLMRVRDRFVTVPIYARVTFALYFPGIRV